MKQVSPPGPPSLPGPPSGAAAPPASGRRKLLPIVLGVFLVGWLVNAFVFHHENRYERLASEITRAIAANDMHPVEKDFNAIRRPQLENRAKVGALSDFVNADGKLEKVREQTASDVKTGEHRFVATFERGQRAEDLTVDADGKIVDFHVKPLETK